MSERTSGLGFWPKVLLWGGVIAIGALYLGSINDKAARDGRSAPVVEGAAPAAGPSEASVPAAPVVVAAPPAGAGAEPAAAQTLPGVEVVSPAPAVVVPVAASAASDETPAKPAEVSPEEAKAFAKAVASDPSQQTAAPVAEQEPAPAAAPAPVPATETMEERRQRIMAEYEAMRRHAEEEMRRRWEGMGVPGPGMMPYGPYHPGYYPQAPQAHPAVPPQATQP